MTLFPVSADASLPDAPRVVHPGMEPDLTPEQKTLFASFEALGIATITWRHIPVFTMAESDFLKEAIPGTHGRSLLLTNKSGGFWMVSAADETKIDLKYLSDQLQTPRFSFAKPEQMVELLGVTPGSLTPFAAMFDTDCKVQVILDAWLMQQESCVFHPLLNIYSTAMHIPDLQRFMNAHHHPPRIMELSPR
ncbi:MAG TPA: prolyl-tRNA synthetase associated domain-containing protein [Alphaproteobacteria bacterium]